MTDLADLDDIYGNQILEHRRNPRNREKLSNPDVTGRAINPFCGDQVDIQILFKDSRVSAVGIQAEGCLINQATASILSEFMVGMSITEMMSASNRFRDIMSSDVSKDKLGDLGNLVALVGVRKSPVRIKCALLPFSALEETL
tara:strand:+ start:8387 stop:8815 length:429 start_codon:yes stop_codon:yes gene_type:complete